MRKMNKEDRKIIESEIRMILTKSVGSDYVRYILKHAEEDEDGEKIGSTFMEDVIEDVMCSSAWDDEGYYNEDDIRLSIGRVLMDRLGIYY